MLLVAAFMGQFDFFVVNVAAPAIQSSLGASEMQLELVVGGYAFAYASGLIVGGRLGDLYGHRRMYGLGLALFGITSLLCGLAPDAWLLVAARALQGLAAAVMIPQVLAVVNTSMPADRRGWAVGWYGVATGSGAIAGQILGGAFVDIDVAGLGWRAIFLINAPDRRCRPGSAVPDPGGLERDDGRHGLVVDTRCLLLRGHQAQLRAEHPPATLPTGSPVDYRFTATGFPAATYGVKSGSLPTGLSLSLNGDLTGTPPHRAPTPSPSAPEIHWDRRRPTRSR